MAYFVIVLHIILLIVGSKKHLYLMQQNSYYIFEYLREEYRKILDILLFLFIFLLSVLLHVLAIYQLIDSYFIFVLKCLFLILECVVALKNFFKKYRPKLRLTPRLMRLGVINILVLSGLTILLYLKINYYSFVVSFLLSPLCLILSAVIVKPYELYKFNKYVKACKLKLSQNKKLIKIGITGSYGKTSVKNVLKDILSIKYNVLATQKSFNTPLGICISSKDISEETEVFIAEMGARHKGDIKELTTIVNPDIAILSGISNQHLQTFKNLNNIVNTKNELIEYMKDDGFAVFSSDNINTLKLYIKCQKNCVLAGLNNECGVDCYADNIFIKDDRTFFDLHLNGKIYDASTSLLGKHNVSNICLAVSVAKRLKLSDNEILEGIKNIKSIAHRLQLIKGKVTVIDDSYNSNSQGYKSALEVLSQFKGRKVVVTSGLVELGKDTKATNVNFAKAIKEVAKVVIIVGKVNKNYFYEELSNNELIELHYVENFELLTELLKSVIKVGDVVLFENDLPSKYF